jgi:uncharacterized protein YabN with tetrapyrrole methylase and pyrophosphatase domain
MERLRGESGCPWDREQTISSLKSILVGEVREVERAIAANDHTNLKEELGDLLWSILLISQIAKEGGFFDIEAVLSDLEKKIIRRHPHVFGGLRARTAKEAKRLFYEAKRKERSKK